MGKHSELRISNLIRHGGQKENTDAGRLGKTKSPGKSISPVFNDAVQTSTINGLALAPCRTSSNKSIPDFLEPVPSFHCRHLEIGSIVVTFSSKKHLHSA